MSEKKPRLALTGSYRMHQYFNFISHPITFFVNFILIINNENCYCNTPRLILSLLIMIIIIIKLKGGMMGLQLHYGLNDLKDFDLMGILPIILPVIMVGMLLVLIALIDLYQHRKTRKDVLIWTLIILFVNTLGPVLYFVIGRKDSEKS
ncbi:hypothetical protein A33I_09690 [Alkalihalophilus marmarensis DSM 21297]|uniref:Cardiolipin synthase N-terminal domain-containing protein n=1 Tax=Alkalihalophilus marmarensis DSM 21297 TaxID=1188261 RepID=U6SQM1_9BACI|nr:hypothetical protein A33I_09690 [Alkalihalophilus marmarensis DSM 21297]